MLTEVRRSLAVLLLPLLAFFLLVPAGLQAAVLFTGDYAPANWTFFAENSDQSTPDAHVSVAGDGSTATITGGNSWPFPNGGGPSGHADWTITMQSGGLVSFHWNYASDDIPGFDDAGWLRNGAYTVLSDTDGTFGDASFVANAGDVIGFRVTTADNFNGPGELTVSSFDVTPVPEPATAVACFAGIFATLGIFTEWRNRGRKATT